MNRKYDNNAFNCRKYLTMNNYVLHLILGCCVGLTAFTQHQRNHQVIENRVVEHVVPRNCHTEFRSLLAQQNYQLLVAKAVQDISDRSHEMRVSIDVDRPTVLLLVGYQKNHWVITEKNPHNVLAIIAVGTTHQSMSSNDVTTQLYPYQKIENCNGNQMTDRTEMALKHYVNQYLDHPIQQIFEGEQSIVIQQIQKQVALSTQLVPTVASREEESSVAPAVPMTAEVPDPRYVKLPKAEEGIQKALELGLIRPATPSDARGFDQAQRSVGVGVSKQYSSEAGDFNHRYYQHDTYVILKEFIFPEDMYGAHSATFYLAEGVPYPKGELSHSTLYNINDGTCRGTGCGH